MDQDERDKDVTGKPKPFPIREAVGDAGRRRAGGSGAAGTAPESQAPGLRGQRERPRGPRGKSPSHKRGDGPRRPPDRKRAESDGQERRRRQLEPTPVEDLAHRSFEHDGCEWIVRLCGQTSTGSARDAGVPLLHLVFYTAADPSVARGEVLCPGRSLEGLPELRLPELLAKAGSDRPPNESGG